MNLETIGAIAGLISPAVIVLWIWYTEKYRPERQKRTDEAVERQYKQAGDRERSWRTGEESATGLTLELVDTLVDNLIKIADGKSTAMIVKMDGLERQFGILIGYLARQQAAQETSGGGMQDWPAINEILGAAVRPSDSEHPDAAAATADTLSAMVKELNREADDE